MLCRTDKMATRVLNMVVGWQRTCCLSLRLWVVGRSRSSRKTGQTHCAVLSLLLIIIVGRSTIAFFLASNMSHPFFTLSKIVNPSILTQCTSLPRVTSRNVL